MTSIQPNNNNTETSMDAIHSAELLRGLKQQSKHIDPKFFYDERGTALFEQIMDLHEYYPTRTEFSLLQRHSDEIADIVGQGQLLIEPGAGNCAKVQTLLPDIKPSCYVPIDISGEFLFSCADHLQQAYPDVHVHAVEADMSDAFAIPEQYQHLRKTVFYPGSTISNYTPDAALGYLQHIVAQLGEGGGLIIGVDLQKDSKLLHRPATHQTRCKHTPKVN